MEPVLGAQLALTGIAKWGPLVFQALMMVLCGLCLAEALVMARDPERRVLLKRELLRSLPVAGGLVAAQLWAFALALTDADFEMLGRVALMYLVLAVLFPVFWAVGQVWAEREGMPALAGAWSAKRKGWVAGAVGFFGLALNFLIIIFADIEVGEAVTDLTEGMSELALSLLAIWMIFNAPWMEELLMRHYLVARVAARRPEGRRQGGRWAVGAIVLAAVLFAVGHAGHMEPAWPKLLQTFSWGLMLGWARVWLGTWYAVGLHLLWNVTAPLVVPFMRDDGALEISFAFLSRCAVLICE